MAKAPAKSTAPKTGGIHAPVTPSAELAAIVGADRLPRSEVISKVWTYIKQHKLQKASCATFVDNVEHILFH